MAETNSISEYNVERAGEDILFTDKDGNQVMTIKSRGSKPEGYVIVDSGNIEHEFMSGWSNPSLNISGMPLYSSSTMIKLYDHEGGEEVQRMTVGAQSITSTKMNLTLLDKRDNIIAFIAETPTSGVYLVKDAHGMQVASLSRQASRPSYKLSVGNPLALPQQIMFKLVAGMVLFNLMSVKQ